MVRRHVGPIPSRFGLPGPPVLRTRASQDPRSYEAGPASPWHPPTSRLYSHPVRAEMSWLSKSVSLLGPAPLGMCLASSGLQTRFILLVRTPFMVRGAATGNGGNEAPVCTISTASGGAPLRCIAVGSEHSPPSGDARQCRFVLARDTSCDGLPRARHVPAHPPPFPPSVIRKNSA